MYQKFFRLELPPFDPEPDSRLIVLTPTHREALATLVYAMEQREGWALLYGDAGLGKTTLLKALMMELDQTTMAAVVTSPSPGVVDLCNQIALAVCMEGPFQTEGNFFIGLRKLMKQFRAKGDKVLLVIDNAHSLTPEQLTQLRLIASADREEPRVLNVFLSSRPLIKHLLQQAREEDLRQLLHRQRRLEPLTKEDTAQYVRERLRAAGGDPAIFPPETLEVIHAHTQGVPRLINALCLKCLKSADQQGQELVSPQMANQALQDLGPLATILDPPPAPPLLPHHHHFYEGIDDRWSPCADPPPRPELGDQEQHLENRLLNRCHAAYRGMSWWDKTTQFTVEWDNLRRRRLGVLGPAFPSFCPRWVDERWGDLNQARRDADSMGALYTDWIDAQYKRVMGKRLGEMPQSELHGKTARDCYSAAREQGDDAGAQPVKAPFEVEAFDPDDPEHAGHAAKALDEIFELAGYVCAQEKRGAADLVNEAVCQAVLPLKALSAIPKLQQQVSEALDRMGHKDRPAPDPPPKDGRPAIII
ncbi:MAG: AAA family ATPase [Desulfarculus sp.]|nr:AAA family ATPase [Desulfarculus sp.]